MEQYGGRYLGEEEGIILPPRASTRTRLHALGHKMMRHEPGTYTVKELASNEIDAEIFAWKRMEKALNHRVGLPAIGALLTYAPDLSNREILNIVVDTLREKGVIVGKSGREDLKSFSEEYRWE